MRRGLAVLALMLTACMIAPNPDFIDPLAGSVDETGSGSDEIGSDETDPDETDPDECPAGGLDCDGVPGCEAHTDDPATCGRCDKSCAMNGEMLECVDGQCVGTIVLEGLADAHVDHDLPNQNFGGEPVLIIDGSRDAYIDLPEVTVPSGASLDSIALHLSCTTSGADINVYRIEQPWNEQSITAGNAPNLNNQVLSFSPTIGENVIELLGRISGWPTSGDTRSLGLGPLSETAPVEFSSREGSSPPTLVLTLHW